MICLYQCVLYSCKIYYLPVFEPNDYFWQNHWNADKEQRWEAFANAVRLIIAK
jgi:hypothetical protein